LTQAQPQTNGQTTDIDGWDIAEGIAEGGVVGAVIYVVGGAVTSLPASFLTTTVATALTVIGGALTFGYRVLHNRRIKKST
jgi:hypothetical protein